MEDDNLENSDVSMKTVESDEDIFANSQENVSVKITSPPKSIKNKCSSGSSVIESCSERTWRGTPIENLSKKNSHNNQYPPVEFGSQHTILFKLPIKAGQIPQPWPEKPVDKWDQDHVRMPHSASSLYPVNDKLQRRWELVHQALNTKISTSLQLEAAILHYNSQYSDRWDFGALHSFFSVALEERETEYFFTNILPKVIERALSLPKLITKGVPLLKQHQTHSISLSQQQISCLLANAFLCTYPRRNTNKKNSEYSTYPDINFNRLFSGARAEAKGRMSCIQEKLKCLVNYFRRVTITNKVPEGVVTYSRHYVPPDELPLWSKETMCLQNMYVSSEGTIEDQGTDMLQVDFANKFVGGGVLSQGCVQEEIRFVICPELILARLFTEVLDDTEALIVTGCERYSNYSGYADNFEWAGNIEDATPRDGFGRRCCTVVAIDAFRFPNAKTQYSAENINRELNKAYVGFSWGAGSASGSRESVATGNWGCGAFRGDPALKTLLQLMAAARAGRDLAYFTFGDEQLRDSLADMHTFLVDRRVSVGDLWKIITSYNPALFRHTLYSHIYQSVTNNQIPVPVKSGGFSVSKKPRIQENGEGSSSQTKKQVSQNNSEKKEGANKKLNSEEIEQVLDSVGDLFSEGGTLKNVEAKTLNIHSDKELCLKRLSSSWTNLNDSKKDFGSCESASKPEPSNVSDRSKDGGSSRNGSLNRKKKISDYFQPKSKS